MTSYGFSLVFPSSRGYGRGEGLGTDKMANIIIIPVAVLPPARVDDETWLPASITLAGCPTLTYAPIYHIQSEHAIDEMMTGRRRPSLSMRKA